jgi:hypothetical protein
MQGQNLSDSQRKAKEQEKIEADNIFIYGNPHGPEESVHENKDEDD